MMLFNIRVRVKKINKLQKRKELIVVEEGN
jgi:hypothetical protein